MFEEAVRDADRAAKLFRIVVDDVDERDLRGEHAAVVHGLARALDAHGDHDRAAEAFTEAIDRYRALPEADAREELAGTLTKAAVCASSRGDHTAALALITEAVSILRELGDDQDIRLALAEALNNLADTHCDSTVEECDQAKKAMWEAQVHIRLAGSR